MNVIKIIELFEPKVQTILYNALSLSGNNSNFLEILAYYKDLNPETSIYFDENLERSHYSPSDLSIHLHSDDIGTFFHELTHLLHHRQLNFFVPKEFNRIKSNITGDDSKRATLVDYIEYVKKMKEKILSTYKPKKDFNKYNEIGENDDEPMDDKEILEYRCLRMLEDIVDAIYNGESFDKGITYLKDNNSLPKKSKPTSGHGSEYYAYHKSDFLEMIANYSAISILSPDLEAFLMLKEIMGKEMTDLLDNQFRMIYDNPVRSNEIVSIEKNISISDFVKNAIEEGIATEDVEKFKRYFENVKGVYKNNDRYL